MGRMSDTKTRVEQSKDDWLAEERGDDGGDAVLTPPPRSGQALAPASWAMSGCPVSSRVLRPAAMNGQPPETCV